MHICIEEASRVAFTQLHSDDTAVSAVTHLRVAVAWYVSMGVNVLRVPHRSWNTY